MFTVSELEQSSPLSLSNKDCGVFSWLYCKLNKKNDVKDTSQVTSCFLRHSKLHCRNIYRNMFHLVSFSTSNETCFGCDTLTYIFISH